MEILTYFEEGPGTGMIKERVSDIVISAAERIGFDHTHLDYIAIAETDYYDRAIQDLAGGHFTNNQDYIGVGKTISKMIDGQLCHSIVFNTIVFDAAFRGIFGTGGQDFSQWDNELLCFYYIIPHELGHCKDHDVRQVATNTKTLDFSNGFDLSAVNKYYLNILIDEACACMFADKYYSQEMINHRYLEEKDTHNQSYKALRTRVDGYSGPEELLRLAAEASGWIWQYQIQLAKHIISSSYRISDNFQFSPLADIFQDCEEEHSVFLQALDLLFDAYPTITQEIKDLLIKAWIRFALTAGFYFEKRQEGWHFSWR